VGGAFSRGAATPRLAFRIGGVATIALACVAIVAAFVQEGCISTPCEGPSCTVINAAALTLACPSTEIASVVVSGSCLWPNDSGPTMYEVSEGRVSVWTDIPGVCHVKLTFTDGFVYSTDINFEQKPSDRCGCGPTTYPSPRTVTVPNPPDTCSSDASADASDAASDAASDDASDAAASDAATDDEAVGDAGTVTDASGD
jgi:hypothetical protein